MVRRPPRSTRTDTLFPYTSLFRSAFAVLLANAVIGNGSDDRATNPALRWAAPVLAVAVLPLAGIADYSMHLRVIQYGWRSEEHTSELQSLMRISYAVFCLKKKNITICTYHTKLHTIHSVTSSLTEENKE